ncbi:fibroblast growth factor 23 [Austrofundulus limnaeus]|uniref:Fibroblast growth factor 23 n=1 Tax=Austrofundulus limnaeus TaxID=52670 RepID=A0A2I4DBP6_AUSLI|nr:PREDICTED: fibroblast growth factor 23-like [Austrofundulus limnaeus]
MRLALLSLTLITVHVSVTVDCRPPHRRPTGSLKPAAGAHTSAGAGLFHTEPNGSMGKHVHRGLLEFFPLRKKTNSFVSIFGLRKRRFLCADVNRELHKSRRKDRRDCLFQHLWLKLGSPRDAYHSTSENRLLRPGGGGLRVAQRFPHPSVKRQRRSEEVNPADPLRSESHPSHPPKHVNPGHPEQEQAGAVSKETISSCDDPLRVLQANGHGSPVKTNIADRAEHR